MANVRSPGLWLFLAGLEMLFLVHLAEFLYPGYSVSENYISDLGVGPTTSTVIFTAAIILFGLMSLVSAYLLRERSKDSKLWLLLSLSGIGAIGVGIVNEDSISELHGLFALMAFMFGNAASIYTYKLARPPLSYLFVALGLLGLVSLVLFAGDADLGLGVGGMERMIYYPAMFWTLGYGAYLMAMEKHP